jgi:MFS family permease
MGVALSFFAAGTVAGPTISGVLLKLVGYWATWSVPMAALIIDIIARLIMIVSRAETRSSPSSDPPAKSGPEPQVEEESSLLATNSQSYQSILSSASSSTSEKETEPRSFYRIMLSDAAVLTGLAGCLLHSSLLTNFENTIPLHVHKIFGWGSLPSGLLFLSLQAPNIILGPVCGWIRDRVGTRYPATVGWAIIAPFLCLLGTPGDDRFSWADEKTIGQAITITSLIAIGAFGSLVQGAGPMEFGGM